MTFHIAFIATKFFFRQIDDRRSNHFDISIQFHVHLTTFRYLRMNYVQTPRSCEANNS